LTASNRALDSAEVSIFNRYLSDEKTLLWSELAQSHQLEPEYATLMERIINVSLSIVPERGRLVVEDADGVDQPVAVVRKALKDGLEEGELKGDGAPSAATIARWRAEAARQELVTPIEPPTRKKWEGWPRERWLVALAAEWFFVPHAQGVLATCRYRQSTPLVDVRSALHTIWFSFLDVYPQLGRALAVVLHRPDDEPLVFAPFEKLLDAVLEPHVLDTAERAELTKALARTASAGFLEMEPDQQALRPFVRPCLKLLREAGLAPEKVPVGESSAEERVSELIYQLETAADDAERQRLLLIIGRLIDHPGPLEAPS
jgi:hypothetical protein